MPAFPPLDGRAEEADDAGGEEGGDNVDQEPGDAAPGDIADRVGGLLVADAGEPADVLVRLLLDDVDDVVDGDDADEAPGFVDDRGGDEIVALEQAGNLLLVVGRVDRVGVGIGDVGDRRRPLGPQEPVERDRADEAVAGIDDEEAVERLRQVARLAQVVDRLPDRPERRHGDELRLHQAPCRILRVFEAAGERHPLDRRKLGEHLGPLLRLEVFEDGDGVVGLEIADAFGDRLRRQLFEDLRAERLVELGQRGEVEVLAEKGDEPRPLLRLERLEEVAEIGLVELGDEAAHGRRVAGLDRRHDRSEEAGRKVATLVTNLGQPGRARASASD